MDQKRSSTNHRPERQDPNFLFLPWFVTTKSFAGSWALLLLLLFSGVAALFLRVPVYSTGTGVIADWRDKSDAEARGLVVVAFFPAPMVSHLARGQNLSFDLDGRQLSGPIVDARAKPLDRTAAASEFALTADAMSSISDLSAVAIMKLEAAPAGTSPGLTNGRQVDVNYLLTTRRLGSFFPFIGSFFHD
ncbi:MAG TPA: hypothetical protein VN643_17220 [Pyrinomonadaceae bacterium]|nr:hypothetical protein [Pyrinomonadaceae bacterium]